MKWRSVCMKLIFSYFGDFVKGFNKRGEKRWFQHSGLPQKHRGSGGCDRKLWWFQDREDGAIENR